MGYLGLAWGCLGECLGLCGLDACGTGLRAKGAREPEQRGRCMRGVWLWLAMPAKFWLNLAKQA